ncbi:MAG: sarcosine oxidase subunit gamma family protein [Salaquimonas sp.]
MLKANSPLNGFETEINGVILKEVTGRSIVSIAVPKSGLNKLKAAIKKELKLDLPGPGKFTQTDNGSAMLLWMTPEQFFYVINDDNPIAANAVKSKLGSTAYLTDQSDAFVGLSVSGPKAIEALERICPIDISIEKFPVGNCARTMMEHLGAIILRTSNGEFQLMSATSSAKSFLHAVEVSAQNL